MSNHEDPQERPAEINQIISGLERYNPEAVGPLEAYLTQQCEQRFVDGNANRVLLKLYVIILAILALCTYCAHRHRRCCSLSSLL